MSTEIKKISKELKDLSLQLKNEGHPNYHNEAKRLINIKYGKSWRESLVIEDLKTNTSSCDFGKISHY